MEFEELQKIWDTQSNQPLYAINEKALHNHILSKKKQAVHFARITEWMILITYTGGGGFLVWINIINRKQNVFMYLLAAWMIATALYVLISRLRRLSGQHRFNRSMLGDLQHAIATLSYQVRLSRILQWNALPIGILVLLIFWESGTPVWIALVTAFFFIGVSYVSRWEHNIYKAKQRELDVLEKKLQQEE